MSKGIAKGGGGSGGGGGGGGGSASISFTLADTHPLASAQPTLLGQNLLTLKAWNGRIWSGYGDYDQNTGPIGLVPFDPATKTFATTPVLTQQTEAIYLFREIGGKLYVPSTDPRGAVSTDYAVGSVSGQVETWTQIGPVVGGGLEHAFDMATLSGSDLWIAGSQSGHARVYRSTDNGATWTLSLNVDPNASGEARFYCIGVLSGSLYVQAYYFDDTIESRSHVFNGSSWSQGASMLLGTNMGYHTETFGGKIIALAWQGYPTATPLLAFTGNKVSSASTTSFYEYCVDGSTVWLIGTQGRVYSTTDLRTYTLRGTGPTTARSIAVLNNVCYLGTSDSKMYVGAVV